MNIIPELATLFKPAFVLTSLILAVFVISYFSILLIKKKPRGKILIHPGAVLAAILLYLNDTLTGSSINKDDEVLHHVV